MTTLTITPPSRAFSLRLRPCSPALLLAAGFFVLCSVSSLLAQNSCPHRPANAQGNFYCVTCGGSPSGGSSGSGVAQDATDAFMKPIRDRQAREQAELEERINQQHQANTTNNTATSSGGYAGGASSSAPSANTSSRKPDGYDTRQVSKLMGGHGTPAYMGTETEYTPYWIVNGVKQYSAPTESQLAAERKAKAGPAIAGGINLGPSGGGPGPANTYSQMASGLPINAVNSTYLFQPVQQSPSATLITPSGALVDRDGYLVENISTDAADAAHAADQTADRLREENAQADWQRMQKKALQDFNEGFASGSLTWEDHPAKHGYTAQQQATYWTGMRQKIDQRTADSLAGTGYALSKVKSDARDWAEHWERNHRQQTMTEFSETRTWRTKTITEAERDPAHVQAVQDIRAGLNLEMGSRPAFGPGSNENNGGPTASPPVKP